MPKRHSKGGTSSANVVPIHPSVDCTLVEPNTRKSATASNHTQLTMEPVTKPFESWTKDTAKQLTNHPTALETWMVTQATSILKKPCTYAEAVELFQHIDIVSRQPKASQPPPPSRFARALRAFRAVFGTILLGMGLAGCAQDPRHVDTLEDRTYSFSKPDRYGVVCYVTNYAGGGFSCVQVTEGVDNEKVN